MSRYKINKKECEICGLKEIVYLQVHHKDKNHFNNDVKNLQVLCTICHMKEHKNDVKKERNNICPPHVESIYVCSKCKMPLLDENGNYVHTNNRIQDIDYLIKAHKCIQKFKKSRLDYRKSECKQEQYERRYLEIRDYIRQSQ